jgi:hypothetical protein
VRTSFRAGVRLGLLAGVGAAVAAALRSSRRSPVGVTDTETYGDHHPHGRVTVPPEAADLGAPPSLAPDVPAPAWVEAEDGTCPDGYPVKAKLSSRLFHLPGMLAYERTKPDRCYTDAAAAEADGFTRARR